MGQKEKLPPQSIPIPLQQPSTIPPAIASTASRTRTCATTRLTNRCLCPPRLPLLHLASLRPLSPLPRPPRWNSANPCPLPLRLQPAFRLQFPRRCLQRFPMHSPQRCPLGLLQQPLRPENGALLRRHPLQQVTPPQWLRLAQLICNP